MVLVQLDGCTERVHFRAQLALAPTQWLEARAIAAKVSACRALYGEELRFPSADSRERSGYPSSSIQRVLVGTVAAWALTKLSC